MMLLRPEQTFIIVLNTMLILLSVAIYKALCVCVAKIIIKLNVFFIL